jgi:hypothetical protein
LKLRKLSGGIATRQTYGVLKEYEIGG